MFTTQIWHRFSGWRHPPNYWTSKIGPCIGVLDYLPGTYDKFGCEGSSAGLQCMFSHSESQVMPSIILFQTKVKDLAAFIMVDSPVSVLEARRTLLVQKVPSYLNRT